MSHRMNEDEAAAIPALMISGFLGSGKTTLLLRLLQEASRRALKPGLLINELGKQDVDGEIVGAQGSVQIEKLLDGCICCNKKDDLIRCLQGLIEKRPDVIFIELTGVANPGEIARALAEPAIRSHIRLRRVITVLDAEHALEYNSIFSSDRQLVRALRGQMEAADVLVLNKTDLAGPREVAKLEKIARKHNSRAELISAIRCQFNVSPLFEGFPSRSPEAVPASPAAASQASRPVARRELPLPVPAAGRGFRAVEKGALPEANRSYSRIQSVTLSCPAASRASREQIERFLKDWESCLVRAKGYIRLSDSGAALLMQYAGGRITWEPAGYPGASYVVFIGMSLDEQLLSAQWKELHGV